MWQDVRYSLRSLTKHPGFLAAGVMVLALGIGVNTAIFSVINAILFRPLPVHAPEELRYVYGIAQRSPYMVTGVQYDFFLELRERRDLFSDITIVGTLRDKVRFGKDADRKQGEMVSPNYFDVLGVKPLLGRPFNWDEDESVTAAPVAIISYDLWQSRFLGDPGVLGKTLDFASSRTVGSFLPWRTYTIVGVMPRGFKGVSNPWEASQYWVSFLRRAADSVEDERRQNRLGPELAWRMDPRTRTGLPIGRPHAGATTQQAGAAVAVFGEIKRRELEARFSRPMQYELVLAESRHVRLPFDPRGEIVPGRLAGALMSVSGVLLLIAAANLAGMLLARGVARRSELALRLTLGASRWRIRRQLLAESMMLALAGGAFGLVFARWLVDLFIAGTPSRFVRWQISAVSLDVPIDWRVLFVAAVSCLATGLLVGLASARHALRTDLLAGLSGQAAGATRNVKGPLRHLIVIPQVCLSLVLLLIAGVLVKTMIRAELIHPGYDPDPVVLLDYEIPEQPHPAQWTRQTSLDRAAERTARTQHILDRAAAVPGIESVSVTMTTPMLTIPLPSMNGWIADRDGFKPDGRHFWAPSLEITPDYFRTLDIAVLRGRAFDARDDAKAAKVAIVSEDLARVMWPGRDPIGQYFGQHWPDSTAYQPEWREVVGVARNTHGPLSDGTWSPAYYVPFTQGGFEPGSTIAARGTGTPAELVESLKQVVALAEPDAVTAYSRQMRDGIGEVRYPRRVAAAILGLSGAIGLLLASTGLYGVISYSVAQRVREIGVRMALGAERRDIVRMVVREGLTVAAAGIALGFVLSYSALRLTSRLVVAMPPMDVGTFTVVPLLLGTVVVFACYIPALRASRVDPMIVLRGL